MDCDGSLDPAQLPLVTGPVTDEEFDLVLGARDAERGAWPWHAAVANRVLAFELRRRCGIPLSDLGPMRAARRSALLELDLCDRGFGWPLEMVLKAAARAWRIGEVPVTLPSAERWALEGVGQRPRHAARGARHGRAADVSFAVAAARLRDRRESAIPALGLIVAAVTILVGQAIKATGGRLGVFFPPFAVQWHPHAGSPVALSITVLSAAAAYTPSLMWRVRRQRSRPGCSRSRSCWA